MSNELGPRHPDNTPEVAAAKDQIEALILGWLAADD